MKKIISWGMMLAAAFTLTNCAKEIEDPNQQPEKQGYPFEIVASTVDTKTVNDGMATKWDDNDAINLFHAVAGAQDYGTNNEFTIANVETGRFTGMLTEDEELEAGKSYDWYALYPYNSHIATPGDRADGDRTDGFTYIGHRKGLNQTGYDNMASLKETICPLYGVAKAVPSSDTPSITMNHLTSVVAIKVTNTTEEPLTITTASLTAEEDIVGSYFIDITKSPVVYKASEGYVKNTAVVNVSDGTALAKGGSATLYLAIKPFTAKAGTSLTLSVNDYAKEPKVLTSDVTFHAGKIKTLNFAYDYVAPKTVTWDLSEDETSEATTEMIAWDSDYVSMSSTRASSQTTAANNYYPGGGKTSTRFYKNNSLTVAPKTGYKITSVVFTATSDSYASALSGSTWTNASAEVSSTTVTVTPTDGTQPMTATIGGTCGFTSVVVYYADNDGGETPEPEPKTLVSIAVENPQTEYTVGDEFVKPTVKATYDDASTATVTGATFSGNDLASEGTKEVTVSYTEGEVTVTTSYNITVSAPVVDDTDYSGTYAIVAYRNSESRYYYLTNEETSTSPVRLTAVSAGANKPEDDVVVDASKLWNVSKSGSVYTIQSVASEEYVYWTSGNSAVMSETGLQFTVTKQDDGSFNFVSGDRYLSLNSTTGTNYFAMYAGTQTQNLYLIKAVEGEEAVPELTGITVNATKTTFTVGEEFAFEGTVTANYSNGTTKDVTTSAAFSGYNMSQEGPQTITVTYEGKTATYDITVNPAQSGGKELEIFKESFGDNSGSARAWNDSYKEQSGISNVYSASTYVMTNLKQGKNTVGYVKSAINQSSTSTPAYFEVKNLNVGAYSNFKVSYYWKAGSIKATYYTKLYYSTDGGSSYQEVEKDSGTGATSFVEVRYTLPSDIKTSSLSLKVEFFTSNTQASIDEFVLSATN